MADETTLVIDDVRRVLDVTILSGQSLSEAQGFGGYRPVGIVMPAAWTAASLTFQGSMDGATYQDVYDDAGVELSLTVGAARDIGLSQATQLVLAPWRYLKLRSGASATPVAQAADRTIGLVVVPA